MGMLLILAAALLGTAIATTGLFLFISRYRHGRSVAGTRVLHHGLLGGVLFAVGLALLATAWVQWPGAESGFDPNRLLAEAPPAAIPEPVPPAAVDPLAGRQLVVLVWGTPSDVDRASPAEETAFAERIANLARQLLSQQQPSLGVETLAQSRVAARQLINGAPSRLAWCQGRGEALVLALAVEARRIDAENGYAPWREPVLELYDCRAQRGVREIGRVDERLGDPFPYAQALTERLQQLLQHYQQAADAS
jgi:hypothetical protein